MRNIKKISLIYFIISLVCIVGAVGFFVIKSNGYGVLWLAVGVANLCAGIVSIKRNIDEKRKKK